jgi:hypothetical protein
LGEPVAHALVAFPPYTVTFHKPALYRPVSRLVRLSPAFLAKDESRYRVPVLFRAPVFEAFKVEGGDELLCGIPYGLGAFVPIEALRQVAGKAAIPRAVSTATRKELRSTNLGRELPAGVHFSFAVSFAKVAFAEIQKEKPFITHCYERL